MQSRWNSVFATTNAVLSFGWVMSGCPLVAETFSKSGFDAVVIDAQHGAALLGGTELNDCIARVRLSGSVALARAPAGPAKGVDAFAVGALLDAGARGVIAPLIESRRDAEALVRAVRYPGDGGARSWGSYSALARGESDAGDALAIAMVETGVAEDETELDGIAATEGLDALFIGTVDLALSLGLPATALADRDPRLLKAMDNIRDAAKRNALPVGLFAVPETAAEFVRERGFDFAAPSADVLLLRAAAAEAAALVSGARGGGGGA